MEGKRLSRRGGHAQSSEEDDLLNHPIAEHLLRNHSDCHELSLDKLTVYILGLILPLTMTGVLALSVMANFANGPKT